MPLWSQILRLGFKKNLNLARAQTYVGLSLPKGSAKNPKNNPGGKNSMSKKITPFEANKKDI